MLSRASIAILILLAGAAGASPSFAASGPDAAAQAKAQQAKAKQLKLARQKKAKAQAEARAKAKAAAQAKALEDKKKDEWYAKDRDRGLDIASEYAPKTIEKIRKRDYIAKGDTVNTGGGQKGWRRYMDKYYSR
jgi:hypothetical protein